MKDVTYKEEKLIITPEFKSLLEAKFPNINIDNELEKAAKWLVFNKPKKDYKRFVVNWLNKIQPSKFKMDNHSHSTIDHNSGFYSKLPDLFTVKESK